MLGQLKERIVKVHSIVGVELLLDANGQMTCHWLQLSLKKQVLVKEKNGTVQGDLKELLLHIPKDIPLAVAFSGKGVLHKKVKKQAREDHSQLFDYVFPNARKNDYWVQYYPLSAEECFVSVIRREQAEKVLQQLNALGYDVLGCSLGGFAVSPMFTALQYQETGMVAAHHQLQLEEGRVLAYSFLPEAQNGTVELAGEKVEGLQLIPYAIAFQYLIAGLDPVEVDEPLFEQERTNFQDKRLFKILGVGALAFFFAVLIANTMVFTLLSSENKALVAEYESIRHVNATNQKGSEDFSRKETFLSSAGWLLPAVSSYYADRIAASLPSDIRLSELSVYPFNESQSRKDKKEVFDSQTIRVSGMSENPTDLNDWIKVLNGCDWIKQVKVQEYKFDQKTRTGEFSLVLDVTGELE